MAVAPFKNCSVNRWSVWEVGGIHTSRVLSSLSPVPLRHRRTVVLGGALCVGPPA